jgi:hypothetical protein
MAKKLEMNLVAETQPNKETESAPTTSEPKRIAKCKTETVEVESLERGSIIFSWPSINKTETVRLNGWKPELIARLAFHGVEQKLRDCQAGREVTAEIGYGAFMKLMDAFNSGSFNVKGDGGPSETSVDLVVQAVGAAKAAAGKPFDADAFRASYIAKTKDERAAIAAIPQVAAEIARLKAARKSTETSVDLDSI